MPLIAYIIAALGITACVGLILSTLTLKHAELQLKKNEKKLIELYKDYIVFLKIYRNVLIKVKQGRPLDDNDLKWCEHFANEHQPYIEKEIEP